MEGKLSNVILFNQIASTSLAATRFLHPAQQSHALQKVSQAIFEWFSTPQSSLFLPNLSADFGTGKLKCSAA